MKMTNKEALKIVNLTREDDKKILLKRNKAVEEFHDALAFALEKQIPKDVICDKNVKLPHAFCPSCNRLFYPDEPDWECKYCQTCGQALKWGNEKDA